MEIRVKAKLKIFKKNLFLIAGLFSIYFMFCLLIGTATIWQAISAFVAIIYIGQILIKAILFFPSHLFILNSDSGIEVFGSFKVFFQNIPWSSVYGWDEKVKDNVNVIAIFTTEGLIEIDNDFYTNYDEARSFLEQNINRDKTIDLNKDPQYELPSESNYGIYYYTFFGLIIYLLTWIVYSKDWTDLGNTFHYGRISSIDVVKTKRKREYVLLELEMESLSEYEIESTKAVRDFKKISLNKPGYAHIGDSVKLEVWKNDEEWHKRSDFLQKMNVLFDRYRYNVESYEFLEKK